MLKQLFYRILLPVAVVCMCFGFSPLSARHHHHHYYHTYNYRTFYGPSVYRYYDPYTYYYYTPNYYYSTPYYYYDGAPDPFDFIPGFGLYLQF